MKEPPATDDTSLVEEPLCNGHLVTDDVSVEQNQSSAIKVPDSWEAPAGQDETSITEKPVLQDEPLIKESVDQDENSITEKPFLQDEPLTRESADQDEPSFTEKPVLQDEPSGAQDSSQGESENPEMTMDKDETSVVQKGHETVGEASVTTDEAAIKEMSLDQNKNVIQDKPRDAMNKEETFVIVEPLIQNKPAT